MSPTHQLVMNVATRREGGYFAKNVAKCPEKVAKDNMPNRFPVSWKEPHSAFLTHLLESGNRFEADIFASIVEQAPTGSVVLLVEAVDESGKRTAHGKDQLERDTFAAIRDRNVRVVLGGRIGSVFEQLLDMSRGGDGEQPLAPWHISQPDIMVMSGKFDSHGNPTHIDVVDVKDHNALTGAAKPSRHLKAELSNLTQTIAFTAKGAVRIDDCDQLAHYTRHLQLLNLDSGSGLGWIVGRERVAVATDLTAKRFLHPLGRSHPRLCALEHYDYWTAVGRDVVDNALARDLDPSVDALTFPEKKDACGDCDWRAVCAEELSNNHDGGHITLLPGITPARAKAHYEVGVTGIRQVARLDPVTAGAIDADGCVDGLAVTDPATAAYATTTAKPYRLADTIWQARAVSAGRVCRAVGVTTVDLLRADVEVDFDLENSPGPIADVCGDGDHHGGPLVYLWGTRTLRRRMTRDGGVRTTVHTKQFSSFTDTSDGERDTFVAFWRFLTNSRRETLAAGKSWRAYHYTGHEITWMRTLANRYCGEAGVPSVADVEALLATGDVVDLYKLLTTQLVWPTKDHSIKTLAKWARFSWRADDAGGDNSMVWYEQIVRGHSKRILTRRLLDYNVDDVAAQAHLRDWLDQLQGAEQAGKRIPAVNTLRGPLTR